MSNIRLINIFLKAKRENISTEDNSDNLFYEFQNEFYQSLFINKAKLVAIIIKAFFFVDGDKPSFLACLLPGMHKTYYQIVSQSCNKYVFVINNYMLSHRTHMVEVSQSRSLS